MTRARSSWSNFVDVVEGPCAVCGKPVRFVIPRDRPDPAVLNHSTCDIMPVLRTKIKSAGAPRLPGAFTLNFKNQ